MYRYRVRRKKSFLRRHGGSLLISAFAVASASFGYLGAASSDIDLNSRFFSEGLKIKLDRSSPAFAALEDSWIRGSSWAEASSPVSAVRLAAGEESAERLVEKLVKDNQRERSLLAQERAAREANSRAMAQAAAFLLKKMSERLKPRFESSAYVAADTQKEEVAGEASVVNKISLAELNITREELLGSLFLPIAQSELKDGPPWQVATGTKYTKPQLPSHDGHPVKGENDTSANPYNSVTSDEDSLEDSAPSVNPIRQVIISGNIELADGLALTNPLDRLVVYREIDGEAFESGAVWVQEARYNIFVEETVGHLVAELMTPYGDVIGRGIVDLERISAGQKQDREITGIHIVIRPVPQGLSGSVIPGEKDTEVVLVGTGVAVQTDAEGRFSIPSLSHGSNVIVRADRAGYWGSVSFAHAGENPALELYEDGTGSLANEIAGTSVRKAKGAIVFGRVTYQGKPVAGAQVDLVTAAGLKPIYFNEALKPDPSLDTTSKNGLYAFYPVNQGTHAVQVTWKNGRALEPVIFPAETAAVSRVDIEAIRDQTAKIKVFDAFRTNYALPADVAFLGDHRVYTVDRSGVRRLKFAGGSGVVILEARSGTAYERTRLVLDRSRNVVYFPMVQTAWLRKIQGSLRINALPGRGTIVAFVQGNAPYKVSLTGTDSNTKVVYFSNAGEILPSDYGEPGGGFAVFNVEEGFQTVTIQASGSIKAYSTVSLVERNVVSVISQWLR